MLSFNLQADLFNSPRLSWFTSPEQVRELEVQLQKETARADRAERVNTELQDEHQAACDLARSKDQLLDLGRAEITQLRESLSRATAQQEEHGARWDLNVFTTSARVIDDKEQT